MSDLLQRNDARRTAIRSSSQSPTGPNELSGSTPGAQSHLPGEDASGKSAAGQVAGGTPLDTLGDRELPEENRKSSGESMGDDDDHAGDDEAQSPPVTPRDV